MNKFRYSFNDSDLSKLYIVSDLHLNHKQEFLWKKRCYDSAQDHTDKVIKTINDTCRPQDILFCLGDFCLNTHPDDLLSLINRIHCTQWWLSGNHNNPWEKKYIEQSKDLLSSINQSKLSLWFDNTIKGMRISGTSVFVFDSYLEFAWNGQMCTFFHYPIAVWNQMQHGAWNCVGHSHYSYPPSRADNFDIKQLDCGWEGHNKPLSFEEIKGIMDKKKVGQLDHHNKDTN